MKIYPSRIPLSRPPVVRLDFELVGGPEQVTGSVAEIELPALPTSGPEHRVLKIDFKLTGKGKLEPGTMKLKAYGLLGTDAGSTVSRDFSFPLQQFSGGYAFNASLPMKLGAALVSNGVHVESTLPKVFVHQDDGTPTGKAIASGAIALLDTSDADQVDWVPQPSDTSNSWALYSIVSNDLLKFYGDQVTNVDGTDQGELTKDQDATLFSGVAAGVAGGALTALIPEAAKLLKRPLSSPLGSAKSSSTLRQSRIRLRSGRTRRAWRVRQRN